MSQELFLPTNAQEAIKRLLGLQSFICGMQRSEATGEEFYVKYIWVIVLHGQFRKNVMIATVKKSDMEGNESLTGILLVPKPTELNMKSPENETIFIEDIKPITLPQPNSVEQSMHSITVLPLGGAMILGAPTPGFFLYTSTYKAIVEYFYKGVNEAESMEKFSDAIWGNFKFLLKEHNHDEMNYFWEHYGY